MHDSEDSGKNSAKGRQTTGAPGAAEDGRRARAARALRANLARRKAQVRERSAPGTPPMPKSSPKR